MVRTVARTAVGRARDHNEDSVLATEMGGRTLLVVADGMGGHRAGDVASETAVEAVEASLREYLKRPAGERPPPGEALEAAAAHANEEVRALAAENPEYQGMGTTLVAALVDDERITFVNVGDSRGYLVGEELEQVTVDQSLVQELVEQGEITPEEAADHPQRNVVSQSLGTDDSVDPDVYERPFEGTALLCSDGLTEEVPESEIHEVVTGEGDLAERAETLIERANEHGGSDNISVVLGE